ncbi:DUF4174 domain-containing protein [Algoriphagus namhaensis]
MKDFRWENRLLVAFDLESRNRLVVDSSELRERKLLYFFFEGDSLLDSNYEGEIQIEDFLKLRSGSKEHWHLIGLDGGVKRTAKGKIDFQEVFRQIDSMPMRQSEMRKKGNG